MPFDRVNHDDVCEIILRMIDLNWRQVKERVSVRMKQHISANIEPAFQTTFNSRYLSYQRFIFLLQLNSK